MNWKNQDTHGIYDGQPNPDHRSVADGGWKEYLDALQAEQRREPNRRTKIQDALNGEIQYIRSKHYVTGFTSDATVDTIAKRYNLPCWGQRASRRLWIKRVLALYGLEYEPGLAGLAATSCDGR